MGYSSLAIEDTSTHPQPPAITPWFKALISYPLILVVLSALLGLRPSIILAGTVDYTYDLSGRLTKAVYGNGRIIYYAFDAVGNILEISHINPQANTDLDGVPDGTELGPLGEDPTYDGDRNGIPDYREARAASLPTAAGGQYVTLSVPAGLSLTNVRAVGNPSPANAPENVEFPYGFFEFTVTGLNNGACTVATLHLPEDRSLTTYFKFSGTPENTTPHWYPFLDNGLTGATISHQPGLTTIALSICDDQRGDGDLSLNGTINDPGGPARIERYYLYLPVILKP